MPTTEELEEFGLGRAYLEGAALQKGQGCPQCMNTGYQGRVAAYEVLFMNAGIRSLVKQGAGAAALRRAFAEGGGRTILEDGLDKVRRGITTLDEVRRALVAGAEMDGA